MTLKSFWNVNDGAVRFDLEVHLSEHEDGLSGPFIYNTDLFDAATIRRMIGHFETLLEEAVANPDRRIATLPYLTAAERRQLLTMSAETQAGALSREAFPPLDELSDEEVSALLNKLLTNQNEQ
jgi:non-ribosomal peptide synthetase component F